jgi:hypothetical protein
LWYQVAPTIEDEMSDFFESSQQAFGRRTADGLLWITWIQTSQSLIYQGASGDALSQGQDRQGQGQETHQAFEMVFPLEVNRMQTEWAPSQTGEIPFDIGNTAIGQNSLGKMKAVQRHWSRISANPWCGIAPGWQHHHGSHGVDSVPSISHWWPSNVAGSRTRLTLPLDREFTQRLTGK